MNYKDIIAQDRVNFEGALENSDPARQSTTLIQQFHAMFTPLCTSLSVRDKLVARVDAFMGLLVEHEVSLDVCMQVLRSTISSKEEFSNYKALRNRVMEAINSKPGLVRKRIASTTKPFTGVSVRSVEGDLAKITKLQGMVKEYQDWTSTMSQQRLHGNYDPKNQPSKDQLRVRDSLMADIQAELDVPFLARLLTIAEQGMKQ